MLLNECETVLCEKGLFSSSFSFESLTNFHVNPLHPFFLLFFFARLHFFVMDNHAKMFYLSAWPEHEKIHKKCDSQIFMNKSNSLDESKDENLFLRAFEMKLTAKF